MVCRCQAVSIYKGRCGWMYGGSGTDGRLGYKNDQTLDCTGLAKKALYNKLGGNKAESRLHHRDGGSHRSNKAIESRRGMEGTYVEGNACCPFIMLSETRALTFRTIS